MAEQKGLLMEHHHQIIREMFGTMTPIPFKPPKAGLIASFIHHPSRQKYFLKLRNTPFFDYLASTDWFGSLLFRTGLRQDVFLKDEIRIDTFGLDPGKCTHCNVCKDVCPLGLCLPDCFKMADFSCLKCLYCYCACPEKAISYTGDPGFFAEQERQYDKSIRAMFS